MGKQCKQWLILFGRLQNHCRWCHSHEIKSCLLLGRKTITNLDSILKSRDIALPAKVHLVKAMVFPVITYGCEIWTITKAECHRIELLNCAVEDSWESLELELQEIQVVHPKGNQPWIFIRRTDAEAETPVLWPPDAKSWLIWKDPDAGKDCRQEDKGKTEGEMVGWHHLLMMNMSLSKLWEWWWTGRPGVLQSMGSQELNMTEWLNWTSASVAKTPCCQCGGVWVQSLVKELDPTCFN